MRREGLTLVEVLVAVFILGIVLTGLLTMVTGTISFSSASVSVSERVIELNDVTGYMTDSIRRATQVLTSATVNAASAPGGGTCSITSSTVPCFSVVIPEAVGGTTINKYTQLFYRVEPRSQLPANYKVSDSWADANTYVVKEYRHVLCDADASSTPPPCGAVPPAAEATVSGSQWYLVLDGMTLTENATPLAYNAADGVFTLRFRVADHQRGTTRYTPPLGEAPYQITVGIRNSPSP